MGFLLGDLQLFSRRGSRIAFGFCATGLSTRRSGDGIFVNFLGSGAKGSEDLNWVCSSCSLLSSVNGLFSAPMTPLFALTKRDRCFGAFVMRSFIGDFFFFFFRGPCLYFTRGYIGFRLIKNLTPLAPEWTLESFPREEKSTGPSVHCADLHMRKRKDAKRKRICPTSPFGYFPPVAFTHFLHVVLL